DLDLVASRPELKREHLDDLAAIGLDWDGPVVRQSERRHLHDAAIARLDEQGLLYPCFCTRREIREAASAPHAHLPEGAYPGTCRTLSRHDRAERMAAGRHPALRIRAGGEPVTVHDRLKGAHTTEVDDFVVRRNDGAPAYNLAVVVDDADQQIDQVVRGDDLLATTPRQVLLQRHLGLPTPAYIHVPLVLGPSGDRLAKRDGAVTLAERLARGETPAQVLALLGSSLGLCDRASPVTVEDLLSRFEPASMSSAPWRLPPDAL
ncbi:MAG TPA: tRNA glutamyl-Q(34) synthetase GluQRS, partial [Acidimicrobiales bacterium]